MLEKQYKNLKEYYVGGGSFSLSGSLKGCTHRNLLPYQTCWCIQPSRERLSKEEYENWPKEGKCYYELLCNSCDINRSC